MEVSLSSLRQNSCLIGYSSLGDKDSCSLCCVLIMRSFCFAVYIHVLCVVCVCGEGGDLDKMNDQTVTL